MRSRLTHESSYSLRSASPTRDAVEADGAAHVEAVADVPRVLTLLSIDGHPRRSEHLELFALVEHVLFERLAVDFAPFQDFLHERVQLVRGRRGGLRRGRLSGRAGGQAERTQQRERDARAGRDTVHKCLRRLAGIECRRNRAKAGSTEPSRLTKLPVNGQDWRPDEKLALSGCGVSRPRPHCSGRSVPSSPFPSIASSR